ncbi:hypothetical protein BU16DRAFT_543537 [Lophium mytilinum]|uniref:Uncharacterized protein n=1 Tax=Lophium mytilinum TaxID=390894 RepID=A0A6A6QDK8_9PEZI|nr:hypothetical protein BU16DRAFT_543537 [Lophium mytilinum]
MAAHALIQTGYNVIDVLLRILVHAGKATIWYNPRPIYLTISEHEVSDPVKSAPDTPSIRYNPPPIYLTISEQQAWDSVKAASDTPPMQDNSTFTSSSNRTFSPASAERSIIHQLLWLFLTLILGVLLALSAHRIWKGLRARFHRDAHLADPNVVQAPHLLAHPPHPASSPHLVYPLHLASPSQSVPPLPPVRTLDSLQDDSARTGPNSSSYIKLEVDTSVDTNQATNHVTDDRIKEIFEELFKPIHLQHEAEVATLEAKIKNLTTRSFDQGVKQGAAENAVAELEGEVKNLTKENAKLLAELKGVKSGYLKKMDFSLKHPVLIHMDEDNKKMFSTKSTVKMLRIDLDARNREDIKLSQRVLDLETTVNDLKRYSGSRRDTDDEGIGSDAQSEDRISDKGERTQFHFDPKEFKFNGSDSDDSDESDDSADEPDSGAGAAITGQRSGKVVATSTPVSMLREATSDMALQTGRARFDVKALVKDFNGKLRISSRVSKPVFKEVMEDRSNLVSVSAPVIVVTTPSDGPRFHPPNSVTSQSAESDSNGAVETRSQEQTDRTIASGSAATMIAPSDGLHSPLLDSTQSQSPESDSGDAAKVNSLEDSDLTIVSDSADAVIAPSEGPPFSIPTSAATPSPDGDSSEPISQAVQEQSDQFSVFGFLAKVIAPSGSPPSTNAAPSTSLPATPDTSDGVKAVAQELPDLAFVPSSAAGTIAPSGGPPSADGPSATLLLVGAGFEEAIDHAGQEHAESALVSDTTGVVLPPSGGPAPTLLPATAAPFPSSDLGAAADTLNSFQPPVFNQPQLPDRSQAPANFAPLQHAASPPSALSFSQVFSPSMQLPPPGSTTPASVFSSFHPQVSPNAFHSNGFQPNMFNADSFSFTVPSPSPVVARQAPVPFVPQQPVQQPSPIFGFNPPTANFGFHMAPPSAPAFQQDSEPRGDRIDPWNARPDGIYGANIEMGEAADAPRGPDPVDTAQASRSDPALQPFVAPQEALRAPLYSFDFSADSNMAEGREPPTPDRDQGTVDNSAIDPSLEALFPRVGVAGLTPVAATPAPEPIVPRADSPMGEAEEVTEASDEGEQVDAPQMAAQSPPVFQPAATVGVAPTANIQAPHTSPSPPSISGPRSTYLVLHPRLIPRVFTDPANQPTRPPPPPDMRDGDDLGQIFERQNVLYRLIVHYDRDNQNITQDGLPLLSDSTLIDLTTVREQTFYSRSADSGDYLHTIERVIFTDCGNEVLWRDAVGDFLKERGLSATAYNCIPGLVLDDGDYEDLACDAEQMREDALKQIYGVLERHNRRDGQTFTHDELIRFSVLREGVVFKHWLKQPVESRTEDTYQQPLAKELNHPWEKRKTILLKKREEARKNQEAYQTKHAANEASQKAAQEQADQQLAEQIQARELAELERKMNESHEQLSADAQEIWPTVFDEAVKDLKTPSAIRMLYNAEEAADAAANAARAFLANVENDTETSTSLDLASPDASSSQTETVHDRRRERDAQMRALREEQREVEERDESHLMAREEDSDSDSSELSDAASDVSDWSEAAGG